LREMRACFVTLRERNEDLRGCTGTLVARQALAQEVGHTTVQTALHDPRFPPVRAEEVPDLQIEISILTPPVERPFQSSNELLALLRPHVDGVILVVDGRRATFLPQVWERVPDPVDFLNLLCRKMGLPSLAWTRKNVQLYTYEAIVIEE
jgi:AmmeMemoRadiSam system protein A